MFLLSQGAKRAGSEPQTKCSYLDDLLVSLIINLDACDGFFHLAKDHVEMLIIRLHMASFSLRA